MKQSLKILIFLLVINTLIFIALAYPRFTGKTILMQVNVTRVIDGDTFEAREGKIRLLGINTPEKGTLGYQEAKNYLETYLGKQVELEIQEQDKYGRKLAYMHAPKLVNEEILKLGLAHVYSYEEDKYTNKLLKAESEARLGELGIWKKSNNYGCLELAELKYEENERCNNQEQLILNNDCAPFNAVLKDDATHIYKIKLDKGIFVKNFSCIWNDDGDSVYIWDGDGLVFFYRYG